MGKVIALLLVLAGSFQLWVMDIEYGLMDSAYRTVQYGLDHAAHDAALQIDKEMLSKGSIQFSEPVAEATLIASLQRNMPIDSQLRPITTTFLEEPMIINNITYIDDDYIDITSGDLVEFPFNWNVTLPDGENLTRAVFGPSIALVVEVKVKGAEEFKPFVVIQEYKE